MARSLSMLFTLVSWLAAAFVAGPAPAQLERRATPKALPVPIQKQATHEVSVDAVEPGSVRLEPGREATATIKGQGLNRPGLSLQVRKKDGSSAGGLVTASLGGVAGATSRTMTVRSRAGAKAGAYEVLLTGAGVSIPLPLGVAVSIAKARARPLPTAVQDPGEDDAVLRERAEEPKRRAYGKDAKAPLMKRTAEPEAATAGAGQPSAAGLQPEARTPGQAEAEVGTESVMEFGRRSQHRKIGLQVAPTGSRPPAPQRMVLSELPEDASPLSVGEAVPVVRWETQLQASQGSGDMANWGALWTETDPMPVSFRWLSELEGIDSAEWQLSQTPDFASVWRSGPTGPVPAAGHYGFFSIDLREFAGSMSARPFVAHARVVPRQEGVEESEQPMPSSPVMIRITDQAPPTEFKMPVITDIMPFSSCSPEGGILLKGYQFGDTPGVLKLIGDFPGGELELSSLEWTDHSAGGRVPRITGVLDQPVNIQLVTADGWKSDVIPCAFTALREERTLAFPGHFSSRRCDPGDNMDTGQNLLFPDVQGDGWGIHHDQMADGRNFFGCRHSNNRQGGDNTGTDIFYTIWLQNDWTFDRMKFSSVLQPHVNYDAGKILAVTGWKEDATKLDLEITWMCPEGQWIRYSITLYMEGPAGVPHK